MDEEAEMNHPAYVADTPSEGSRESSEERGREVEVADPDALARLSDPSIAARRERISAQVKDRSGLHWVPATELLRQRSQRAGDAIANSQEQLHRLFRDRTVAGVKRTAAIATERVAALGRPRPTGRRQQDASMSREAAS